jgi:hypothetical protein
MASLLHLNVVWVFLFFSSVRNLTFVLKYYFKICNIWFTRKLAYRYGCISWHLNQILNLRLRHQTEGN